MKQELRFALPFGETLRNNLDGIKEFIRQDNDFIILLIGRERIGKSNLGAQVCMYMDDTFTPERMTLGIDEFQIALEKAKQYQAIDVDEGVEALFSKNTMTRESKQTTQTLTQIGSKNLFIVVTAVDPFLVDRYIFGHRASALIRILRRGIYAFYSKERLGKITQDPISKKTIYPKPNFVESYGKMNNKFWMEYLQKKESFQSVGRSRRVWKKKLKIDELLKKSYRLSDLQTIYGVSRGAVQGWIYTRMFVPKKYWFVDPFGQRRITEKGFKILQRNLDMHRRTGGV